MRHRVFFSMVACLGWLATTPAHGFGPEATEAAAAFRFVVFGDAHVTVADLSGSRAQLRRAVDEINGLGSNIAFVLVAGDMAQSEMPAEIAIELAAAKEELDRLVLPYHAAMGNHDVPWSGDDTVFRSLFGPTTYRFSYAGVQFIDLCTAVNSTSTVLSIAALDSLSLYLSQISPTDPLIVFGHHPLGPVAPFAAANKEEFYSRVDPYNLKAVFNGHYHGVFEEQRHGAWYCTSRALSDHRTNHDGSQEKGYRLATVWPDGSVSSSFYALGQPPTFAPSAPAFLATGNRYALPGRPLRLQLQARASDGNPIVYASAGLPPGATFDAASRLFTWTPQASQIGLRSGMRFLAGNASGTDTLRLAVRVLDQACLYENFEPPQAGWVATGGVWGVRNGELVQSQATGGSYSYVTGGSWSDLYLESDFVPDQGVGYAGLLFRYLDSNNNYYVWNNGLQIEVRRRVNGVASRISSGTAVGPIAGWHHVRVEALGPHIKVYWDGQERLDVVDSTFASGKVGLVCSQAAARFDNVVVTGCQDLYDRAPVLQPIGPRTAFVGAPLVFDVGAGDPDGQALVLSAASLPRGAVFAAANGRFAWTPLPGQSGIWRGATFRATDGELDDAETVTFTVLDTSRACLYEGFAQASASAKWQPTGGTWNVADGAYVGTTSSTSLSTYGPSALENFTYQARLRSEGTGSGNLVFRCVDATHYYYLSTSTYSNTVELRKMQGANSIQLAGGGEVLGSVQNTWHQYQVQVENDVIRVWVDGERRFEYRDAGTGGPVYVAGGIGVRVQNGTVRIDDVLVSDCGHTTAGAAPVAMPALSGLSSYPNPFNPQTTVSFELAAASPARVAVFDVSGRLVHCLFDGALPAGTHRLAWDGRGGDGRRVASGVYYLRASAGGHTETRSLVLLK